MRKPILSICVLSGVLAAGAGLTRTAEKSGHAKMEAAMKKSLGPIWSADDIAAGEQMAEKWKTYASGTGDDTATPLGGGQGSVASVLAKHQDALMAYPNVVAVSDGICMSGDGAGQACINVYVSRKIAADMLADTQKLPESLDGVRVEVIEAGEIGTLPME
jgi:hypothetical protein